MEDSLRDNSEKVAYFYKLDDPEYATVKDILSKGGWYNTFLEIATLDDVKEIVSDKDYYAWDEMWIGAKNDTSKFPVPSEDDYGFDKAVIKELESQNLDKQAIWDKLKEHYEPVVGYAYTCVNANPKTGNTGEYEVIMGYKKGLKKERDDEFFKTLKPGDYISALICDSMKGNYPDRFIFIYAGEGEFALDYNRSWKKDTSSEFKEGIDMDPEGWRITWGCIDRASVRKAELEEIVEVNEAIEKAGLKRTWQGKRLCLRSNA